jgi:hypothetical protein
LVAVLVQVVVRLVVGVLAVAADRLGLVQVQVGLATLHRHHQAKVMVADRLGLERLITPEGAAVAQEDLEQQEHQPLEAQAVWRQLLLFLAQP